MLIKDVYAPVLCTLGGTDAVCACQTACNTDVAMQMLCLHVSDCPPVTPVKPDLIPEMSDIDLRALSEKMKKRELMDIEWRRQQSASWDAVCQGALSVSASWDAICQGAFSVSASWDAVCQGAFSVSASWDAVCQGAFSSKIGKIQYLDNKNDVRLQQFVLELDFPEWTPEQVYNLVTMDGTAARPEDHGVSQRLLVGSHGFCIDQKRVSPLHLPCRTQWLQTDVKIRTGVAESEEECFSWAASPEEAPLGLCTELE
eukprot:1145188-Pelagomonas_calceolata.AAC.2